MVKIKKFAKNTAGTDYVVGDIHGCFNKLQSQLSQFFNPRTDRLFSVGDLVDRGPDNVQALTWLDYPWFFPDCGNHDVFVIQQTGSLHKLNGGNWFYELDQATRDAWSKRFALLPDVIEVETSTGLVGILHGEYFGSWKDIASANLDDLHWGRKRIQYKISEPVLDVDRVYVGHTPIENTLVLGNTYYIDNLAWHPSRLDVPFNIQKL